MAWMKRWSIEGSKDDVYTVAIDANGQYGCSCPHWKFRRGECRHIMEVKIMALEEKVIEVMQGLSPQGMEAAVAGKKFRTPNFTVVGFEDRTPRKFNFEG
jgi:hypothetical protein